jgi:hypothetical protein
MKKNLNSLTTCAVLVGTVVTLVSMSAWAESKPKQETNKTAPTKADVIEVPRSEFVFPAKAGDGRDPFFPLSTRIRAEGKPANSTTPKPVSVSLTLNGISGTESKRFALINGKTFVVGDQLEVPIGDARVRVLCVEIREDSTIVEVNGSRQELRLKPGI